MNTHCRRFEMLALRTMAATHSKMTSIMQRHVLEESDDVLCVCMMEINSV